MWAAEGYVKEIKGDLLTADVKIRGHQVNCRGVIITAVKPRALALGI